METKRLRGLNDCQDGFHRLLRVGHGVRVHVRRALPTLVSVHPSTTGPICRYQVASNYVLEYVQDYMVGQFRRPWIFGTYDHLQAFSCFFARVREVVSIDLRPTGFFRNELPRIFPVFLFQLYPYCFYRYRRTKVGRMFRVFKDECVFHPCIYLCPLCVDDLLLYRCFECEVMEMCLLRDRVTSSDFKLANQIVLVDIRVAGLSQDRCRVIHYANDDGSSLFSSP